MPNLERSKRMRARREARGLTQAALAQAASISRQSLSAIEAGRAEPSVSIALRIAAALDQRVEELFGEEASDARLDVELVGPQPPRPEQRVALALIRERWVAHPLSPRGVDALQIAASGVVVARATKRKGKNQVELLQPIAAAREAVVIAGCAPALGVLAQKLNGERGPGRFIWLEVSSTAAMTALRDGHAHVAGVHLADPNGESNVAAVRRALPHSDLSLVTLACWHAGLLVAHGNPLRIRGTADLGRSRLRLAARERGAGARALLEQHMQASGLAQRALLERAQTFTSHFDVAHAIALGAADTGLAMESAALAYDLDFLPLARERFDLVAPRESLSDPRIARMFEMLASATFRRELATLGGYDAAQCGVTAATIHAA